MDKLESDLESFVRICHLHEKVDMLEHALAEKDREIQQIREHYRNGEASREKAYQRVMRQAVRFGIACMEHFVLHDEAKQFLASPEVREWREQEEQP